MFRDRSNTKTNPAERIRSAAQYLLVALSFPALGYVYYWALQGDIFRAMAGAAFAVGSIAIAYGIHSLTQLRRLNDAADEQLTLIRKRLDAIELLLEEIPLSVDVASLARGDLSDLVAGHTEDDAFPRIVAEPRTGPPGETPTSSHDSQERDLLRRSGTDLNAETSQAASTLSGSMRADPSEPERRDATKSSWSKSPPLRLTGRTAAELRFEFRRFLHAGDYVSALEVGEEILATYADTSMAIQFEAIRNALQRRALGRSKSYRSPAV